MTKQRNTWGGTRRSPPDLRKETVRAAETGALFRKVQDLWYIYNLNQFKSYIYIYIYHSSSVEYDIFFTFYFAALIIWFKGTILNSWSWEWQVWNHDSYIYLARILSPGISVVFLWNPVNIITVTDIACGVPPGHQTSNTTPLVWFWPFCYA